MTRSNADQYAPLSVLRLDGSGTAGIPQRLEVMGNDVGNVATGFNLNFAYGSIALSNNTYVRLVDLFDNATGAGAEALYVNSLIVPAGTTLDLNGLHLYTRATQIAGTIVGGTIGQIADSGPILTASPTPGSISVAGELDEWTFFARAGRSITVIANPGSGGSAPPGAPRLDFAEVRLVDASGNVLGTASSATSGALASLEGVILPADGTYRIQVHASAAHTANTGNYTVAFYDVTTDVAALTLGQRTTGAIEAPFDNDLWTFTGAANQQVRFDLLAASSLGLLFDLSGPNGPVFTGLNADSDLITLPASGSYVLIAHGTGEQTGAYSFRLDETSLVDLPLGSTHSGTLAGSGQAQLFRIDVIDGRPMLVTLDDTSTANHNELYVKLGSPPTRGDYDFRFSGAASPDQQITVPMAVPGSYYALVYGDSVPAPSTYTLKAETSGVFITHATPDHHGNNAPATLTLTGAGFDTTTTVSLVAVGGATISPATLSLDSPTQITATFAAGIAAGHYALRVSEPGASDELAQPFTVVSGGQAVLTTDLIVPRFTGRHALATLYVEYANTGDIAMPAPLLTVHASDRALLTLHQSALTEGFWTSAEPAGFSDFVQFLASGETPGLLQPGESVRVPVYFAGLLQPWDFGDTSVHFDLEVVRPDNTTPLDWTPLKETLRPQSLASDAWTPIWNNYLAQIGNTAGGLVAMLNDNAAYLGRLGEPVTDVNQLLAFELQQANALSPVRSLERVVDVSVDAPGFDLVFSRVLPQTISQRYDGGPFGRGWAHNWEFSLQKSADGTVTITGPTGGTRVFQPDSRSFTGAYFSQAGDHATLTALSGGAFSIQENDGQVMRFRADGKLEFVQDTNGNRITAGYTGALLTNLAHSSGRALQIAYNAAGHIDHLVDPFGRTTQFAYDTANQHLLSVTDVHGMATTYTYLTGQGPAKEHALASIQYPGNTYEFFTYDASGRIAGMHRDGNAEAISFSYDSAGRVTATDAMSGTTDFFFDHRGLVVKTRDALGSTAFSTFDEEYNLTNIIDPAGQSSTFNYDARGNLVRAVDPLGHTATFTYTTQFNRLASFTDANGNTTRYGFDNRGNLLTTTAADGSVERLTYDPFGDVDTLTNRRGSPIDYDYDTAGHLTRKTFADGSHTDYTYDTRDRLATATDASGTTVLAYDTADRLTKITYPSGRFLSFTYDDGGRRTQSVDQDGFTVNYTYDAAGRLSGLKDGAGNNIVTYTFDAAGYLARKDNGNGTYTTYEYDRAGQLLHLVNRAPDNSVQSRFDYTYDNLGRRTSMGMVDGQWTYEYDATGQLTHAVLDSTNPAIPDQDLRYIYDAAGNRLRTVENGVTTEYTPNNLNQYTTVGSAVLTYDADGNLISKVDGTDVRTYSYNADNRLVRVVTPEGSWNYEYDAFGNRSATLRDEVRVEYLLDPAALTNIVGEYAGGSALIANYTYGFGLASRHDASQAGSYYAFDGTGNTAEMTNDTGSIANRYVHTPFGKLLSNTEGISNPFTYVGQFGIVSYPNELIQMRARFYGSFGRFLTADPSGFVGGFNLYTYVKNNPVGFVDPTGEVAILPGGRSGRQYFPDPEDNETGRDAPGSERPDNFNLQPYRSPNNPFHTNYEYDPDNPNPFNRVRYDFDNPPTSDQPWSNPWEEFLGFCVQFPWLCDLGDDGDSDDAASADPNSLTGPAGFGSLGYVPLNGGLPYRIDFENEAAALAPAQRVVITNALDADLDWNSFQLTAIGFGDQLVSVPAGSRHFQTSVDFAYNGRTLQVQIEAGIVAETGTVFAAFQAIDPATNLPPDVLTGFLPPEDGTGRGMGHVGYVVQPRGGLATGTEIRNVAFITFDANEAIATNQVDAHDASKGTDPAKEARNTIDADAPSSAITTPATTLTRTAITLALQGQDVGAGVAGFDIYVSDNAGAYVLALPHVTGTTATYLGQPGHTYRFYSIARDQVGNTEAAPAAPDTTITLPPAQQIVLDRQHPRFSFTDEDGTAVTATWAGAGIATLLRWDDPVTHRGDLHNIAIAGSDAKSTLTIAPTRGDTTLGGLQSTTALATLNLKGVHLLGNATLDSTIGKITLGNVLNGADITIAGTLARGGVTVAVGDVTGDSTLTSASALTSLQAIRWTDGAITAPTLGALTITGQKTPAIAGDFGADLALTNGTAKTTLGTAKIAGAITGGAWNIAGPAGQLTAGSIGADWTANFAAHMLGLKTTGNASGDITALSLGTLTIGGNLTADLTLTSATAKTTLGTTKVAGAIESGLWQVTGNTAQITAKTIAAPWTANFTGNVLGLKTTGNASGNITANAIGTLSIGGDYTNAQVKLNQAVVPTNSRLEALHTFTVLGTLDGSQVLSSGHIGSVTVGAIKDSRVLAGVKSSVTGLPTALADFESAANLGKFTIAGLKSVVNDMLNSDIAARTIGSVVLRDVKTSNAADGFGVAADKIASLQIYEGKIVTSRLAKLDTAGEIVRTDDFVVATM